MATAGMAANKPDAGKIGPVNSKGAFRPILIAGILLPIVVILLMSALLGVQIFQRWSDVSWTEHSDEVLEQASQSIICITRMSSAIRDYVISGDAAAKSSLRLASDQAADSLASLTSLVRDNPGQLDRLARISEFKGELSARYEEVIQDHDAAGCANCSGDLAASRQTMQRIAGAYSGFVEAELNLRNKRRRQQGISGRNLLAGLSFLVLFVVSALAYSIWSTVKRVAGVYDEVLHEASTSRAQAEQLNRAKDEFLSVVSHELRGPLSGISMWTQVLLNGCAGDQKTRKGLEAINRAIQSESQMINDLLDISRIEAGKLRLDVCTVDLRAVIEAALEAVRPSMDAREIQLHVLLDTKAGPVAGDPERLQQVLWNLLSNAAKFTPKQGHIEVKLERLNSHVEITVSDNGCGIEAAALRRIFQPFWQEENGPSRIHTGLGLGLSIVRQIVEMHGGSITALSDGQGHGATFVVILPISLAHQMTGDLREHPTIASHRTDGSIRLDGMRILAVDDQPDAIAAIRSLLQSCGADVHGVESARAALDELREWRPDVIVSDVGMPAEDGYYLIRRLRGLKPEDGGDIPAIALTAYGRVQDTVRLLEAGFQMHVTKPVEADELFAAIRSVSRHVQELNK